MLIDTEQSDATPIFEGETHGETRTVGCCGKMSPIKSHYT